MRLAHSLLVLFVAIISSCALKLSLQSGRGSMKLKNFLHLHKHRLNVEPLATLEVVKEMKCTVSCTKSADCVSFNVKKLSETNFLCELLNTSKYRNSEYLTQDDGFTHWYLQDPCVPTPCKSGYCKPDKQTEFSCVCDAHTSGKRCEICKGPSHNFALGKPATQSEQYSDMAAGLAVDGNNDTETYNADSQPQCATSFPSSIGAWWRVDFQQQVAVARVAVTNRKGQEFRLADFEITVGDSLMDDGLKNPKCGNRHTVGVGTTNIMCTPIVTGRYLVIHTLITRQYLNVCEVAVYCHY